MNSFQNNYEYNHFQPKFNSCGFLNLACKMNKYSKDVKHWNAGYLFIIYTFTDNSAFEETIVSHIVPIAKQLIVNILNMKYIWMYLITKIDYKLDFWKMCTSFIFIIFIQVFNRMRSTGGSLGRKQYLLYFSFINVELNINLILIFFFHLLNNNVIYLHVYHN